MDLQTSQIILNKIQIVFAVQKYYFLFQILEYKRSFHDVNEAFGTFQLLRKLG